MQYLLLIYTDEKLWAPETKTDPAILQDITAAKKAARALRASEQHYRATFEQAAVGIVHTSLEGEMWLVNQAFRAMTGYSRAEARQTLVDSRALLQACRGLDLACGPDRPLLPTAQPYQQGEVRPADGRETQRQQTQSAAPARIRRPRAN